MPHAKRSAATALASVFLIVGAVSAQQRRTGVIGAYTPPRVWPQAVHHFNLLHQRIAVQFDEARRSVQGEVTTRVAVTDMPTDTIRLNAENLTIDAASDAKGALHFRYDTTHVTVRLRRRAAVGDTVEFTLRYHGTPERGLYFVPRRHVIWSQGEATETRAWIPTYDAANDKTTWDFFVTADSGMKVLSNGTLVNVTPVNGGAQAVWHWAQREPASTYLYSVVVGPFTVLHDHWRNKPVDYWVYPDTTVAGWRTFGETPAMIELYSRLLGVPFPWDKYDQSAIPDFTYGGMENVSATTQTDLALHGEGGEPEQDGRSLVAHELAHQWFGDYTTTANWANAWLNEGITTYMESVENEKTRGLGAAQLEWWRQQQQAMRADLNQERPLVWGKYRGTDPIRLFFSGHVYPKGAQLVHQLRHLLGDSVFWAGMHRFLVDNAHKPVTTKDYAVAFEKTCHCDLDWFFDQWAYGIGYPRLDVSRQWDSTAHILHVTVKQTQPIDSLRPVFKFPVTIRVITADSVVRQKVMVSKVNETFAMPLPSTPLSFRFDEGGWLLGTVHTDQTPAELADMAEHDLETAARNWALRALDGVRDSAAVAARRFVAVNDRMADLRAEAIRQLRTDGAATTAAIVRAALRDPSSTVRAQALNTLSVLDPTAATERAQAMFENDPNEHVRITALEVYSAHAGDDAVPMLIDATAADQPDEMLTAAARRLGVHHGPEVVDALNRLMDPSQSRNVRTAGLDALVRSNPARAVQSAGAGLADPDPLFAVDCVRALARIGTPDAQARLRRALASEHRVTVHLALVRALGR